MQQPGLRTIYLVYAGLIILLLLTIGGAALPLGELPHTLLAFGISILKTVLIVVFFMELYYQPGLTRIFASAGVIWLAILFLLTLGDYLTRNWRY